jgi:hypothetical protein
VWCDHSFFSATHGLVVAALNGMGRRTCVMPWAVCFECMIGWRGRRVMKGCMQSIVGLLTSSQHGCCARLAARHNQRMRQLR